MRKITRNNNSPHTHTHSITELPSETRTKHNKIRAFQKWKIEMVHQEKKEKKNVLNGYSKNDNGSVTWGKPHSLTLIRLCMLDEEVIRST